MPNNDENNSSIGSNFNDVVQNLYGQNSSAAVFQRQIADQISRNGFAPLDRRFSYWENPQRVVRSYNFLRTAKPDWKPPEWMNVDQINEAYEYLKYRNSGKPTYEWKALPEDDPGTKFLQGIATPPEYMLLDSEKHLGNNVLTDQQVQEQQPFDWSILDDPKYKWMKWYLGMFVPQTDAFANRPSGNKFTASAIQSVMLGLGVGAGAGAITANPLIGLIAGVGAAGLLTYQNYTGNQVPLLNEIMRPFNLLAEGTEGLLGMNELRRVEGLDEVLDDLPAAYKAGQTYYDTMKAANVPNWMAGAYDLLNPNVKIDKADKNEIWKISQGILEPVAAPHGKGGEAIAFYDEWIETGKANEEFLKAVDEGFNQSFQMFIWQKAQEEYGDTAISNDIVFQTILDPLNVVPWAIGKTGGAVSGAIAKGAKNATTARVAGTINAVFKQGTGNIIIDALPMGLQQIVSGITKLPPSKGIADNIAVYKDWIRNYTFPASLKNAPDDMKVKYAELVKQGVDIAEIKTLGDTITWKDKNGVEQAYKGSRPATFELPTLEDLSPLERFIGGIDPEYGFKELRPTKNKSFISKLSKLTPESQVAIILNTFHHNIATLMDAAAADPQKMADLAQKMIGNIETKPGDLGEAILKSPAMRAVQAAMQFAVKDGDLVQEMLGSWLMGGERRNILEKVALMLDADPNKTTGQKIANAIQELKDNPVSMAQRLNKVAPELKTSPEVLKEALKVFTGDDPLPWSAEQFQAQLVNSLALKMDDFFKEKYGLQQESWIFRASNAMKGVQSLILLGFNPAYFMNNWINNIVTRSADGVGGYMNAKQINDFYQRFGIFPKDTGLSSFDEITGTVLKNAKKANEDGLDKAQRAIAGANKLGVFSRLSHMVEKSEGNQARVIAMKQFMDKTKKVDVGIRRMSPIMEAIIDQKYPGMKDRVYAAINAGMNMKEIEADLFAAEYKPHVESIIDEIDKKYFPNMPGTGTDLMRKLNLIERMNDRLKDAKTPEDVDAAFKGVADDFDEWIRKTRLNDLITRAEETKNVVTNERGFAIQKIMADAAIEYGNTWETARAGNDLAWGKYLAGEMDWEHFINELNFQESKTREDYRQQHNENLQAYKGVIQAIGIDNDYTRGFVIKIGEMHENMETFWKDRQKLYKEFEQRTKRGKKETFDAWQERKKDLKDTLDNKLEKLYDDYTAREMALQEEMDTNFVRMYENFTGWDVQKIAEYCAKKQEMRKAIVKAQKDMRKRTKGLSVEEKDVEYQKFNPIYNKMIADFKQFEHDGAYALMDKPAPDARVEIPVVVRPDGVRDVVAERAINLDEAEEADLGGPAPIDNEEAAARVNLEEAEGGDQAGRGVVSTDQMAMMREEAKNIGFTDEQLDLLAPRQIAEAVNQARRSSERDARAAKEQATINQMKLDNAKAAVKARITAEDIIRQADDGLRREFLHQNGLLSRSNVEEQMRAAFPDSNSTEIAGIMALIDLHAEKWARTQGWDVDAATARDAWYATHIKEVTGEKGNNEYYQRNFLTKKDLDTLINQSAEQRDHYLQTLREVADETGAYYDPSYEPFALKKPERIREKAGTGTMITDALRYTLIIDNHTKYLDVIDAMEKRGYHVWQHDVTNMFQKPGGGYRHVAIKFTLGDGDAVVKELQLLTPNIAKVKKDFGWDYYKLQREMDIVLRSGLFEIDKLQEFYKDFVTRMDTLYTVALSLDAPEMVDPIAAKTAISDALRGPEAFSSFSREILETLRNPRSAMARNSSVSSAVSDLLGNLEDFVINHTSDIDIIQQKYGQVDQILDRVASRELYQTRQGNKASVSFAKDGRAVIRALQSPDVSSMVHEIGHIFRRDLNDADLDVVAQLGGLAGIDEFRMVEDIYHSSATWLEYRRLTNAEVKTDTDIARINELENHQDVIAAKRFVDAEEAFARGWERYLAEGDAPTPALRSVFRQFTDWMLKIYTNLKKSMGRVEGFEKTPLGIDLNQKINGRSLRDIFDGLLVDQTNRPKTFDQLLSERAADVKSRGRNWTFDDAAISKMARKELINDIFQGHTDEAEARSYLESMDDYSYLGDGTQVDDVAMWDALKFIQDNPDFNPWNVVVTKKVAGATASARTPKGDKINMQYKMVDLDDLEASDNWYGNTMVRNENYNQELQGRIRGEKSSVSWMMDKAKPEIFDPGQILEEFRSTDRGTPIIVYDNQVWSGNGRVNFIRYGIMQDLGTYEKYRAALDGFAEEYGIDPASYADMTHPFLVREITDDVTPEMLEKWALDSNKGSSASMSDFETAINEGNKISDEALRALDVGDTESIESTILAARNYGFIKGYLTFFDDEALKEISYNGKLTEKGVKRIVNALLAKVYKGPAGETLVRIMANGDNSLVKNALAVLKDTLPQLAVLEGKIGTGLLPDNLKISDDLAVAIDTLNWIRGQKKFSVNDYLTGQALIRKTTPFQDVLIQFLDEAKPNEARQSIRNYAAIAQLEPDTRQMDMFGETPRRSKEEIFNDARTVGKLEGAELDARIAEANQDTRTTTELPEQPIDTGAGEGAGGLLPGSEGIQRMAGAEGAEPAPGGEPGAVEPGITQPVTQTQKRQAIEAEFHTVSQGMGEVKKYTRPQLEVAARRRNAIQTAKRERYEGQRISKAEYLDNLISEGYNNLEGKNGQTYLSRADGEKVRVSRDATAKAYLKTLFDIGEYKRNYELPEPNADFFRLAALGPDGSYPNVTTPKGEGYINQVGYDTSSVSIPTGEGTARMYQLPNSEIRSLDEATVRPEIVDQPAVIEPWQMKRNDFVAQRWEETRPRAREIMAKAEQAPGYKPELGFRKHLPFEDVKELDSYERYNTAQSHQEMVRQALAEGKPVPAEVLADYPGLKAKSVIDTETKSKYDAGDPIPLERAAEIDIDHNDVLQEPAEVQAIREEADSQFKFWQKQKQDDYLEWILNGEKGPMPEVPQSVIDFFEPQLDTLREHAAQKSRGVTAEETYLDRALREGAVTQEGIDMAKEWTGADGEELAKRVLTSKKTWEIPLDEILTKTANQKYRNNYALNEAINFRKSTHKMAVRQALSEGKPVPAEVLADYPDLQPVKAEISEISKMSQPEKPQIVTHKDGTVGKVVEWKGDTPVVMFPGDGWKYPLKKGQWKPATIEDIDLRLAKKLSKEKKLHLRQWKDELSQKGITPESEVSQNGITPTEPSTPDQWVNAWAGFGDLMREQNAKAQPGINIQKVFKFKHGEVDCVANVYKDGELIAYQPAVPLKDAAIDDNTRILGLDPNFPDKWVYEQDGEIKVVDAKKPGIPKVIEPETDLFGNPVNQFELTSQKAKDQTFNPKEIAKNDSLFDRSEYMRTIEGKQVDEGDMTGTMFEQPEVPHYVIEDTMGRVVQEIGTPEISKPVIGALDFNNDQINVNAAGKIIGNPSYMQHLRESIWEGESRLKAGKKSTGAKYEPDEIAMIQRTVAKAKAKLEYLEGDHYLNDESPQAAFFQSGQLDMFSQTATDLPLFSGTPMSADDAAFKPKDSSPQMSMFPTIVPEAKPTRILLLAIKEKGSTAYVRIDLKKTNLIRETLAMHAGAEITGTLLDAKNKVVKSNFDPKTLISPTFSDENGLFQSADVTRTPEFWKWFGESKIVDENGDPRTAYHGGRTGREVMVKRMFDVLWFTSDPDQAANNTGTYWRNMTDPEPEYMPGANVREGHIRMENPEYHKFDGIVDPAIEEKVIEQARSSGKDGVVFTKKDGTEYYAVFDNNQFKSKFNRGTYDLGEENPLYQSAETQPNSLMAIHNTHERNLSRAHQQGGFPSPSIAIIGKGSYFDQFGDISMIGNKKMIDPQADSRNAVFDADIYSATPPKPKDSKPMPKPTKRLLDKLHDIEEVIFGHYGGDDNLDLVSTYLTNEPSSGGFETNMLKSLSAGYAFLKEKGLAPFDKPPMMVKEIAYPFIGEQPFRDFMAKHPGIDVDKIWKDPQLYGEFSRATQAAMDLYYQKHNTKGDFESNLIFQMSKNNGFVPNVFLNTLLSEFKYDLDKTVVSRFAVKKMIHIPLFEHFDEFRAWVKEYKNALFDAPTVKVRGKNVPANLDNMVDAMTTGPIKNQEKQLTYHLGNVKAASARKFVSIDQMHKYADKLDTPERTKWSYKAVDKVVDKYQHKAFDFYKYTNSFDKFDDSMKVLGDYLSGRSKGYWAMRNALEKNGFVNLVDEVVTLAIEAADAVKDSAVDYYEAKPQRAVYWDEWSGAVIPVLTDPATIKILEEHHIPYKKYDPTIDGDRAAKIKEFQEEQDILFQNGFQESEGAAEMYREYSEPPIDVQHMSEAPIGKVPLNGTPTTEPFGKTLGEVNNDTVRPMLNDIRDAYKKKMADKSFKWGEVAEEHRKQIKNYLSGEVANDLSSVKRAALSYGDTMRNNALLDYSRRYGFDSILNMIYPYQFWYTRSMMNWAKRSIDKPAWFAMYARMQQAQDSMEREGMPTRLNGKARFNMPWMPAWMGGGLWTDPISKLFPFDQFGQPFEQYAMNKNQVDKRAEQIIDDMRSTEKITASEAEEALATREGAIWDRAVSEAEIELDKNSNASSLVGMMMQPALWWSIPKNIMDGTPEKIGTLPITRTGQTIRELGKDTFMEGITNPIGDFFANPEEAIRKKAGLSEFGQWGDYYLDRTLAGMAASGEISAEEARIAMIQRSGEAFNEAHSRVSQEQALRTPGAAGLMALKNGAKAGEVAGAALAGMFGGSLFSEGELKMRGLKPIYDNAWNKYNAGDEEAINQFFEDYPEYYARLALYDEPEERLHQFLIDSIWRKYMDLESANKRLARETLGDDFVTSFLNKETRSYEAISDETLARWSRQLGTSEMPEVEAVQESANVKEMEYLDDEVTSAINAYYDEKERLFPTAGMWQNAYYNDVPEGSPRGDFLNANPKLQQFWNEKDSLFPGIKEVQDGYFALPEGSDERKSYLQQHPELPSYWSWKRNQNPMIDQLQDAYFQIPAGSPRKDFLAQHPELQKYWTWKKEYLADHPEVEQYLEELQQDSTAAEASSEFSSPLIRQLVNYATGGELPAGAKSELNRIRKQVAPDMSEEDFIQVALSIIYAP